MKLFSQVSWWIATKLGMCIHPNMVLDEFEGIFDLTPFRGHFGLKTQKKLAILPLMQLFSEVSWWIATKLCICIHLNTMLDEFKGNFDLTPFWVKNLEKIGDLPLMPLFSQVSWWIATKLGMCIHPYMVLDEFKGIFDFLGILSQKL